jgi:hypothetical protein
MNSDDETFVRLKYEIITSESETWQNFCNTYPKEALVNWAWRCAMDVAHFANGHEKAENYIRYAKRVHDGEISCDDAELIYDIAQAHYFSLGELTHAEQLAYDACRSVNRAIFYIDHSFLNHICFAAYYASKTCDEKLQWKKYISWLIEELAEYESKYNG